MPDRESGYFPLSLASLRAIGGWAADCAERALPVYEARASTDSRPQAAIEGIREFAAGGSRTARLRTLALAAHAAAREVGDPAAAAAARAAGLAAASAYTHPLADVHQTKHIVGPAAYAALALELDAGDSDAGDAEVLRAIEHAPAEAGEVLMHMPARQMGKSRLDTILYQVDAGIRARAHVPPASDSVGEMNDQEDEMPARSELIDEMIAKTPDWRGETLARLRELIHVADPEIVEDVKWRRPANPIGSAVFEHDGIVLVGVILKERVRLGFWDGASLPDPDGLYNAQLEGNKSRAIDFYEGDDLREAALTALIREGVGHNLAKVKPARKKS